MGIFSSPALLLTTLWSVLLECWKRCRVLTPSVIPRNHLQGQATLPTHPHLTASVYHLLFMAPSLFLSALDRLSMNANTEGWSTRQDHFCYIVRDLFDEVYPSRHNPGDGCVLVRCPFRGRRSPGFGKDGRCYVKAPTQQSPWMRAGEILVFLSEM